MIHISVLAVHMGHKGQKLIIISNGMSKKMSSTENKSHELIYSNLNSFLNDGEFSLKL